MHERWTQAGFDPDAFWRQTPRSYQSAMQGAARRARDEAETYTVLAYRIAEFMRAKKLERPSYYLNRLRPDRDRRSMLDRLKGIAERTRGL